MIEYFSREPFFTHIDKHGNRRYCRFAGLNILVLANA